MRLLFGIGFLAVTACADPSPEPVATPTFEEDAYEYCISRDEMWLMNLLDRVQRSLPEDFQRGTLVNDWPRLNYVIIQRRISPEGQMTDERELMLHLKVVRSGVGPIQLPVYGRIDPRDCKVDQIEAQVGYDRLRATTERLAIK